MTCPIRHSTDVSERQSNQPEPASFPDVDRHDMGDTLYRALTPEVDGHVAQHLGRTVVRYLDEAFHVC